MSDEIFQDGVDLSSEAFADDLRAQGIDEDSDEWQAAMDHYEPEGSTYLFGDWTRGKDGTYSIDPNGKSGFAATYSSNSGNVCVEYSKTTKRTHHTSPCYVMRDGSGPCGDLDTEGDSVVAYTLPAEYFRTNEE